MDSKIRGGQLPSHIGQTNLDRIGYKSVVFTSFHQVWPFFTFIQVVTNPPAANKEIKPDLSPLTFAILRFCQNLGYLNACTFALLPPLTEAETCYCFQANGSSVHCYIVTNQMKWSPLHRGRFLVHQ